MGEMAKPSDRPGWADFLGPEIGWLTVCGFRPGDEPDCAKSAKWHVWLAGNDGYIGACDDHIARARALLNPQDEHQWGVWCNLPGSIWTGDPPMTWCEQEHGDPLAQIEHAPQPHEQELSGCC